MTPHSQPPPPRQDGPIHGAPLARVPQVAPRVSLGPREILTALRKNWPFALLIACVVSTGTAFWVLGKPKIYQSAATLRVDPNAPQPLGRAVENVVETGTGMFWANHEYYQTQFRIIQSRRVARGTVEALGLQDDLAFLTNTPRGQAVPEGTKPMSAELAAQILRSRLTIEPVRDTRLVEVRLEDTDPARAQRVLSVLVDVYMQQNIEYVLESTSSAADWLRTQLDKLKGELEGTELALHDYKMDKQILSVSLLDQSNMLREEMQQLNAQLTVVRARIEALSARNATLTKLSSDDPASLGASDLLQHTPLQDLRLAYVAAKREEQSLLGRGKGPEHPEVKAAAASAAGAKQELLAEVRNVQNAVARDLVAARAEASGLAGLFADAKKRALDLNLLEIEYRRLERTKENTEKLYSLVLERTKESDLTRVMRFNNVRLVDAPLLPQAPVKPRVPITIALGLVSGLALGFLFAVGKEFLDRTIKTPDDVEQEMGLTFLGLLPSIGKEEFTQNTKTPGNADGNVGKELSVHEFPKSGVAEAARSIRTNLLFMSPDVPFRRLLVTSAGPSEGKTTVACSLAITMAQAGHRVLLVDCDLRRPRIHSIFGRSREIGVTSAIIDPGSINWAALTTNIEGLSVLTCGPHVPNPAEVLHSESFHRLLLSLEGKYDRVVIDSPPLVPVTDAAIISRQVDATVVVARAFKTTKDLARRATRILQDVDARVAGTVLNAADAKKRQYGYYQGYYRDGYGDTGSAVKGSTGNG